LYGGGGPQFFSNGVLADSALIASGVTTNGGFNGQFFSIPLANGNTVQALPGNLGRNTFTGPSWWNMDLSLIKDTHVTERISLQFRAEFFNLANHPTFATPNSTLGDVRHFHIHGGPGAADSVRASVGVLRLRKK